MGNLRPVVWSNQLAKAGGQDGISVATCCYQPDFKKMHQLFCEGNLHVTADAVPMLYHCIEYVKGRAENPIKTFNRGGYEGTLSWRRDGVYLIKDAKFTGKRQAVSMSQTEIQASPSCST